jgi:hypothetical protein
MRAVAVQHLHQCQRNLERALPLLKQGFPIGARFEVSHITSLEDRSAGGRARVGCAALHRDSRHRAARRGLLGTFTVGPDCLPMLLNFASTSWAIELAAWCPPSLSLETLLPLTPETPKSEWGKLIALDRMLSSLLAGRAQRLCLPCVL